nr:uncharacterized protein LOC109432444 [Aedes albopictus]
MHTDLECSNNQTSKPQTSSTTMKFIVAAVVLALAVASEASWPAAGYPWADHGVPPLSRLTLQHGLLPTGPVLGHMLLPTELGPVLTGLERGQLPTGVPQLPRLPTMPESVPGATSVTATRGAVHVAPLPGHAISQKQLNLAPAPGTL